MTAEQIVCHVCGEEIVRDRTCLTGWKHRATDDNVCAGGGYNAVPKYDPLERMRIGPRGGWTRPATDSRP